MITNEFITLEDDEDGIAAPEVDLVVGPTGTAVPITQARFHGHPRLPMGPSVPPPHAAMPRNPGGLRKPPKKPGAMPPFALFIQEHRMKLMDENPNISFSEVGKRLGEMWHALDEAGKEDYRQRSREIGDQKLKEWREKMKEFPFEVVNAAFQTAAPKRRRTHGYAIFSSEMRKQVSDSVALSDTTKMIAEQWRNAPPPVRQIYEARAAAINEAEARKQQQVLMQNQRRQHQLLLQQQQLQQQILFRQHQQQRNQIRAQLYPGAQGASPALQAGRRVLPPPQQAGGSMKLPSSITVSRVMNDGDDVLPPPQQRIRGPPPLLRAGGVPAHQSQLHRQLTSSSPLAARGQVMQRNGLAMKRPMPVAMTSNGLASKRPMVRPTASIGLQPGRPTAAASKLATCRLCAKASPLSLRLRDRPEMLEAVQIVLGIELDLDRDREEFFPERICRSCFTVLSTLVQFRKNCTDGQDRLRELAASHKPKVKTIIVKAGDANNDVDVDLDCEVDEGESVPLPGHSDDTFGLDGDQNGVDPLMFLQLGQVEGNYAGHDEDDDKAETFEDQMESQEFMSTEAEEEEEEEEVRSGDRKLSSSPDNNNTSAAPSCGEKSKQSLQADLVDDDIEH